MKALEIGFEFGYEAQKEAGQVRGGSIEVIFEYRHPIKP